jgi:hypothetical protein
MNQIPKITLLGPIPYNHVTIFDTQVFERYGGITYPTMALSKLFGKDAHLTPVTHLRKKDEQTVKTLFKGLLGIELKYIKSDYDQGDVIRTKVVDERKLLEKQYGFMNPIVVRDVKELLDSDLFIFAPLTDYEISLETLEFIKTYSSAKIIFDARGPTNTMTSLGDRTGRFWVDRDLWLPYIDILVMNLEETKSVWFNKEYTFDQLEDRSPLPEKELDQLAEHCFKFLCQAIYITLGDKGVLVYFRNEKGVNKKIIPTICDDLIVCSIGCREAFLGGLAYGLIKTNDYCKAGAYGNAIAHQRCLGTTYDVFRSAEETEKMVEKLL